MGLTYIQTKHLPGKYLSPEYIASTPPALNICTKIHASLPKNQLI